MREGLRGVHRGFTAPQELGLGGINGDLGIQSQKAPKFPRAAAFSVSPDGWESCASAPRSVTCILPLETATQRERGALSLTGSLCLS